MLSAMDNATWVIAIGRCCMPSELVEVLMNTLTFHTNGWDCECVRIEMDSLIQTFCRYILRMTYKLRKVVHCVGENKDSTMWTYCLMYGKYVTSTTSYNVQMFIHSFGNFALLLLHPRTPMGHISVIHRAFIIQFSPSLSSSHHRIMDKWLNRFIAPIHTVCNMLYAWQS